MDSWNACPEVCLEPVGKVNSLRLAWGTQQVVAKGWMGPKGKFGNGWSLEQRPVDAHWEAGVGEESEHVNDQEGMSGWSHPSVVLGSDPGLGLAGKKPQSYGQAFAFMLASFCSSLLTLQPRLALLPYYQASVCVTMPGSPCLDHRAWITMPRSPCLDHCVWITMPGITKPGMSLLVFILFEFLLKIVLFLNNKQKPRLSYKTALQRRHVKYESGPNATEPPHVSPGQQAFLLCNHVGAFNSAFKGNWLSPSPTSRLKYDCLIEFVCFRDKTLSHFSPV